MRTFTIVFLFVLQTLTVSAQQATKKVSATQAEVMQLLTQLTEAVQSDRPENSYMPEFVRQKISWLYTRANARKTTDEPFLRVVFGADYKTNHALMRANYGKTGLPYVDIMADRIFLSVRVLDNTPSGFSQLWKNNFALALTHETVHLEKSSRELGAIQTREQLISEEFRTWEKVDRLAVEPLIKQGQPIGKSFIRVNQMLKRCNRRLPCEGIVDLILNKQ